MQTDTRAEHRLQRAQAPSSLAKPAHFLFWLSSILATSVVIVFRRRPGFHTVAASRVVPLAVILVFWSDVASFFVNQMIGGFINMIGMGFIRFPYVYIPNSPSLVLFALVMVVTAFVKRRLAWKRLFEGAGEHTDGIGTSYLVYLLPRLRPDRVNRFVEPAAFALAGCWLYQHDYTVMGIWLMLSGAALALTEQQYFEWVLANQFARHNAQVRAQMEAELITSIRASRERKKAAGSRLAPLFKRAVAIDVKLKELLDRPVPDFRGKFVGRAARSSAPPAPPEGEATPALESQHGA